MSTEKEIQLLKEENERLKEKLVQYVVTINELRDVIANHKVGRTKTVTEDVQQEIIKLRLDGHTIKEVSTLVGKSYGSVQAVLKKHGIEKIKKVKTKGK